MFSNTRSPKISQLHILSPFNFFNFAIASISSLSIIFPSILSFTKLINLFPSHNLPLINPQLSSLRYSSFSSSNISLMLTRDRLLSPMSSVFNILSSLILSMSIPPSYSFPNNLLLGILKTSNFLSLNILSKSCLPMKLSPTYSSFNSFRLSIPSKLSSTNPLSSKFSFINFKCLKIYLQQSPFNLLPPIFSSSKFSNTGASLKSPVTNILQPFRLNFLNFGHFLIICTISSSPIILLLLKSSSSNSVLLSNFIIISDSKPHCLIFNIFNLLYESISSICLSSKYTWPQLNSSTFFINLSLSTFPTKFTFPFPLKHICPPLKRFSSNFFKILQAFGRVILISLLPKVIVLPFNSFNLKALLLDLQILL
ncbi:hypothetical protein PAEPH01_1825 [Pancytospora epiphaga]|nr:hypothetical protein PAEPH01_1825 [Pancytospora epiphaga]